MKKKIFASILYKFSLLLNLFWLPPERIFKCKIYQHTFMVGDFNLEYGQRVQTRIKGSDGEYYEAETTDRDPDGDKLRPYVSDLIEFGFTKNVFF